MDANRDAPVPERPPDLLDPGGAGWGIREQSARDEPDAAALEGMRPADAPATTPPLMSFPSGPTPVVEQPPPPAYPREIPPGFAFADAAPAAPPVHSQFGPHAGATPPHIDLFQTPSVAPAPATASGTWGTVAGDGPAPMDLFAAAGTASAASAAAPSSRAPASPGGAPGSALPGLDGFGVPGAPQSPNTATPGFGPQYATRPARDRPAITSPREHDPFRLFAGLGAVCVLLLVVAFAVISHSGTPPFPHAGTTHAAPSPGRLVGAIGGATVGIASARA